MPFDQFFQHQRNKDTAPFEQGNAIRKRVRGTETVLNTLGAKFVEEMFSLPDRRIKRNALIYFPWKSGAKKIEM